ncbi:MAG: YggS family pyridoxal phosphate-dependent enzyme [Erysipelotrichaceae bacterium]
MQDAINAIINDLNEDTVLVAVSKYRTIEEIYEAASCGCKVFGENHVQEIVNKYDPNYKWHMIGHLQKNKVKALLPFVDMIESLDSLALAKEIEKEASKINKVIPVLVQINISHEENKTGINLEDTLSFIDECILSFPHIKIKGLMCVASNTDNEKQVKVEFKAMQDMFYQCKSIYHEDIKYLSMGMSHDYKLALEYGANIVRIGTAIFGERTKK